MQRLLATAVAVTAALVVVPPAMAQTDATAPVLNVATLSPSTEFSASSGVEAASSASWTSGSESKCAAFSASAR